MIFKSRFPSGGNISYDSSRRIENIKISVNTLKRVLGRYLLERPMILLSIRLERPRSFPRFAAESAANSQK